MKKYAKNEWSPEDVLKINSKLTVEEADKFLQDHERIFLFYLREYGYKLIQSLLEKRRKFID